MKWQDFKELLGAVSSDMTLADIEVVSASFDEHLSGKDES